MSVKMEKHGRRKGLIPNVDFYSASVYHCMEIPHDLFTPIFAVSRSAGWIAHILEQYKDNRIMRPRRNILAKRIVSIFRLKKENNQYKLK